jgi:hypothetical protein
MSNLQYIKFNLSKNHNTSYDILEGHLNQDTFITYGIYIKDECGRKKGDEFMEYYTGKNYKLGSTKKSYSRIYGPTEIPYRYREVWKSLRDAYKANAV